MWEIVFNAHYINNKPLVDHYLHKYASCRLAGSGDRFIHVVYMDASLSYMDCSDLREDIIRGHRVEPPPHDQEQILFDILDGAPDNYIIDKYLKHYINKPKPKDVVKVISVGKPKDVEVRIDLFKTQFITIPNF